MPNQTFTIDSQVHSYERNSSARPWLGFLQGPDEVTGDDITGIIGVDPPQLEGADLRDGLIELPDGTLTGDLNWMNDAEPDEHRRAVSPSHLVVCCRRAGVAYL